LSNSDDPPRGISRGCCPLPDEDFKDVNFAYKGIAVRLDKGEGGVAAGNSFALFDHDLMRLTGFWTGDGFIDYQDILLNDRHNIFPRTVGKIEFENPITPGWANPKTGSFEDPRFVAVDGRPFGPLPRDWTHYKGIYYHGNKTIIKYTVGEAEVLEMFDLEPNSEGMAILSRTLNITSSGLPLKMRIAPETESVLRFGDQATLLKENGFHILSIPANTPIKVKLLLASGVFDIQKAVSEVADPLDLKAFTNGGPVHDPQVLNSPIIVGENDDAYAVDVFTLPQVNPWNSQMRPTGIDFLENGKEAVVSTIDGEVFHLEGITQKSGNIKWRRIATGLFQPLGIKIKDGDIYVGCRDQIVILRDLNGDGETDFYESFNSDHQVTEHFHEFAMGLQIDEEGNFYYAKSGRHARTSLVPQHGTLIKVSADGLKSEILANGFRAANGVCLNPDGSFIVTDQEGFWNPMNRINWVEEGGFYGNMWGYGAPADSSDEAMEMPLCWIDMKYDRSPSELMWAEDRRWGPLNGSLLNFSYGYGKIFVVMPQMFGDVKQGGMVELPVPQFPTGIMRGRMNPEDGQLYACGMSAWATNQMIQVGGLYRIRYTKKPLHLPIDMRVLESGIEIRFAEKLDKIVAEDTASFTINTWDLERSKRYGSDRLNEKKLEIGSITLSKNQKTLLISPIDLNPTWVMEILYNLKSKKGKEFEGAIQNTIYELEEVD
jgi:glucose/arabinose dehydrogenase